MIAQKIKFYGNNENEKKIIELLYEKCPIYGVGRFDYQDLKFAIKINAVTF